MFIEYIKEKFLDELVLVSKLINIDEKVQGIKLDEDFFYKINNKNLIDVKISDDFIFILDGNIEGLILLINQLMGYSNYIIVNKNNLAINKWIIKKYIEYCDIYCIENKLNIVFSNVFNVCEGKYIVIGSKSFVLEHKDMLALFEKGIIFE